MLAVLAACSSREAPEPPATTSVAVVRNSIHIGFFETTFYVVDAVDGTKVHEKLDFKRTIQVAAGARTLTVTHYTDAFWGSRESKETCTIRIDAAPGAVYEIQGEAERDQWRARLVDRTTKTEWPCLFPDEVAAQGAEARPADHAGPAGATPTSADSGADTLAAGAVVAAGGEEVGRGKTTDSAAVRADSAPVRRKSFCPSGFYRVARVNRDNTFVLERTDRVRLIGVKPDAIEATAGKGVDFDGKCVRFDYEPTNLIDGHRDREGYLLAYVYLQDGTFVNLELIREGQARASDERHQHLAEFLAAQAEARESGLGIWADR